MRDRHIVGTQLLFEEGNISVKSIEAARHRYGLAYLFGNPRRSSLEHFLDAYEDDNVAMVLPSSRMFVRMIKLPLMSEKRLRQIVRYETAQQVPFPMDEVLWDYIVNKRDAHEPELDVRLVAASKRYVMEKQLEEIAKKVKLKNLGEAGLLLYNSLEHANGDFFAILNVDNVDIGKEGRHKIMHPIDTHLYNNGKVIFSRCYSSTSDSFGEDDVRELQRAIGYVKSQYHEFPPLRQIFLSGDIAKKDDCASIVNRLSDKMQTRVSTLPAYSGRADYAIPAGAAITCLKEKEQINLLPHKEPIRWDVVGKNALLAVPRGIGYALSMTGNAITKAGKIIGNIGYQ